MWQIPGAIVLDIVLIAVLVVALIDGFRRGLLRVLGGVIGMAAGAVAAFFVMPLVATWPPLAEWRVIAAIGGSLVLILIGFWIGAAIGNLVRKPLHKTPLRTVDRVFGAVANTVVTLIVISLLAFSSYALASPALSQAIASSAVLKTLDDLTPPPLSAALAQLRATILNDGVPRVLDAAGIPTTAPNIPDLAVNGDALSVAGQSVVRITGNAPSCGKSSVGSGFVASSERIITNAHVVAGVTELVVEAPGDLPRTGQIVYFDPIDDLAVIATDGLAAPSLAIAPSLATGDTAAFLGYPFGGPFSAQAAEAISTGASVMADIYGDNPQPRQVTTLAANVQQGNSGGPLLNNQGAVAGVIFAKSQSTANIGYALAMDEVLPVIVQAPSLTAAVGTGACTGE